MAAHPGDELATHGASGPLSPLAWLEAAADLAAGLVASWIPWTGAARVVEAWLGELIEIAALVFVVATLLTWIRHRFGTAWLQRGLGRSDLRGSLAGALLGVLTPVCSCGVAALYGSLVEGGASPRAAGSFLFAAPATNELVLLALLVTVGPVPAALYLACGIVAAVATGHLVSRLVPAGRPPGAHAHASRTDGSPLTRAIADTGRLLRRLAVPLAAGAALVAALQAWELTPAALFGGLHDAWFSPVVAALLGLPLHVEPALMGGFLLGAAGADVPLGTLIALTMALGTASIPEAIVLRSLVGSRAVAGLAAWYLAYIAGLGLLVNTMG